MPTRLSNNNLRALLGRLSDRDLDLLSALDWHKYLRTDHVRRLFFYASPTLQAGKSGAMHSLNKLKSYGLVDTLSRRVGGVRAGSASFIWCLTEGGYRLLHLSEYENCSRKRYAGLSQSHQNHILAISECAVTAVEVNRRLNGDAKLHIEFEPACWRPYEFNRKPTALKPDLYIAIRNGEYEDHWFIEVDMDTEGSEKILKRCKYYYGYYNSKIEQRNTGTFPIVVWVVPNEKRKRWLEHELSTHFKDKPKLFAIVLQSDLQNLFQNGVSANQLM